MSHRRNAVYAMVKNESRLYVRKVEESVVKTENLKLSTFVYFLLILVVIFGTLLNRLSNMIGQKTVSVSKLN